MGSNQHGLSPRQEGPPGHCGGDEVELSPHCAGRILGPLLALCGLLASGCSSDYVARTANIRRAYESRDYDAAVKLLEAEEKRGVEKDRLLVLLDKGMVLHAGGRFEESNATLSAAEKLASTLEVVSVTEEAAVLLTNERNKAYRGEDFERLMINVLMALNYASLGKDEDALVEVRRVNERMLKMIRDEKKPYEQLAVARYLGAVLYEDQGELDSAFIDYDEALKLSGNAAPLAEAALRLAKATRRDDRYEHLQKQFPSVPHEALRPDEGEVVVVIETGRSPEKVERQQQRGPELVSYPSFRSRAWGQGQAVVTVDGKQQAKGVLVSSIDAVAQKHLEERLLRIVLKSAAGTAVKAGVAAGIGKAANSEAIGMLAFYLLASSNQPDLRSWLSLPAEFQIARLRLSAGPHQITVDAAGGPISKSVTVTPKRIALVVVRRY